MTTAEIWITYEKMLYWKCHKPLANAIFQDKSVGI